jgi:hypothetical protein
MFCRLRVLLLFFMGFDPNNLFYATWKVVMVLLGGWHISGPIMGGCL